MSQKQPLEAETPSVPLSNDLIVPLAEAAHDWDSAILALSTIQETILNPQSGGALNRTPNSAFHFSLNIGDPLPLSFSIVQSVANGGKAVYLPFFLLPKGTLMTEDLENKLAALSEQAGVEIIRPVFRELPPKD